jgi:hypothetical protein
MRRADTGVAERRSHGVLAPGRRSPAGRKRHRFFFGRVAERRLLYLRLRHEEVEMSVISLIVMEPGSDWPGHVGDSDNVVAGGFDAGGLVQRTRHMLAAAPGLVMTRGPEHAAGSRALTPAWNRAVPVGGGDSPVPV